MKKKNLFSLLFLLTLIINISNIPSYAASSYFSDAEIDDIITMGFPSDYKSYIDKYYEAFLDEESIIESYWGYSLDTNERKQYFNDFIHCIKKITTSEGEAASIRSQLTRALYFEVCDLCANNRSGSITGMKAVLDLITNRTNSSSYPNDFLGAAYDSCLDGFNSSKSVTYWHNHMKNPIADSAWSSNARRTLVSAYMISYIMENEIYDKVFTQHYHRFTSLGNDYFFYNESPGSNRVNYGVFYFRKTY